MKSYILILSIFAPTLLFAKEAPCHPNTKENKKTNYIIGYGSLIQKNSRSKSYPESKKKTVFPVQVSGYERLWAAQAASSHVGSRSTFLGIQKKAGATFNAIAFQVEDLGPADKREGYYCRRKLEKNQIAALGNHKLPEGNYWIYVTKSRHEGPPTKKLPIVQSYVDIFLSGCQEIESDHKLPNFATNCVKTTSGWSKYWVNDRIHPRRPSPSERKIDCLLHKAVPSQFAKVTIE